MFLGEKSLNNPAREAADGVKPGAQRSGTPGTVVEIIQSPRSGRQQSQPLSPAPRALEVSWVAHLGFRCAPPQALCYRPLRGLRTESVITDTNQPDFGKLLDIEMLVSPGGKERTAAEYKELFARAGLRLTRIVPTKSPYSVIEAVKD